MIIYIKNKYFSLVELIVSMAVLLILLAVMLKLHTSATKSTDLVVGNVMMYENANLALDLITSDLQSIYFGNNAPFWHWKPDNAATADWGIYSNELLGFISATTLPQNDESSSLHEVKYQLYYTTDKSNSNYGWLRRSVTGNKLSGGSDNPKWNFINSEIHIGYDNSYLSTTSLTANSTSSGDYQKLIPYVTNFEVVCYERGNSIIDPHTEIVKDNTGFGLGALTGNGLYPYSIQVNITLMDKNSWKKWVQLDVANDANATTFRENNERTFSKMIHIGDRSGR